MFDVVNAKSSKSLLKDGRYNAVIISAVISNSIRNPLNKYIGLELMVENKKVKHKLNLVNSNPEAVDSALSQVRSILECTNQRVINFNTMEEMIPYFVNKEIGVQIKTTKDPSGQYADKNEVHYFLPVIKSEVPKNKLVDEIPF